MYGDAWKMWTLVTIDGARVRSQTIEGHAPEVDVGDGVGSEKVIAFFSFDHILYTLTQDLDGLEDKMPDIDICVNTLRA